MSDLELQDEEREVLLSIYDGDPAFKQISPNTYQYKYGEDGDVKSFLLEISWGGTYPTEKPAFNLNAFYNKHLVAAVKERIAAYLSDEADQYLGTAMTYTLFESVKECLSDLVAYQPDTPTATPLDNTADPAIQDLEDSLKKVVVKKEQLSKAQKRKQWDRVDGKGERPRGWDWVDIVKHLSQTGSKESPQPMPVVSS